MKIILLGACGKMGANVTALCKETGDEIVCGVDLAPKPAPFPVYDSFEKIGEKADVVIDFSSPQNLTERLDYCKAHALPILLAATGYSEQDLEAIQNAAASIAVFKTGNLSLGVNVLQKLVKKAAAALADFDAEIIEKHHNLKKDAPSGTALMLAESAKEGFGGEKRFVCGRHGIVGAREKSEVIFAGTDEIVTLSHSARSRMVFASGALKAAAWLIGRNAGLYDMDDLLETVL